MLKGRQSQPSSKGRQSWVEDQAGFSSSSFILAYDVILLATHRLRRQAWIALLEQVAEIVILGAFASVRELEVANADQETVLLVDAAGDEERLALELQSADVSSKALFLVDSYALGKIVPLLHAGALGCLKYDASLDELSTAIAAIGSGQIALPADVAASALARLANPRPPIHGDYSLLSDRESEVVSHLVRGQTNKEIARDLGLSVRTIEAHLRNVYGKLGVSTRTEAVLKALRWQRKIPQASST
jgi:DNA-binding NarL/FixJ family response regulator